MNGPMKALLFLNLLTSGDQLSLRFVAVRPCGPNL